MGRKTITQPSTAQSDIFKSYSVSIKENKYTAFLPKQSLYLRKDFFILADVACKYAVVWPETKLQVQLEKII